MRFIAYNLLLLIFIGVAGESSAIAQTALKYYDDGVGKYNIGDYEGALLDFNTAVNLDLSSTLKAEAYANMGNINNLLGNREQAIQNCDKALAIDVTNIRAYVCKGNANIALRNREEALVNFKKILSYDPKNINAYVGMGIAKNGLGDYKNAIKDFDTAIVLGSNDPRNGEILKAYLGRGLSKLKLGQEPAGCQDLTKAWQLGYYEAYEFVQQFCTKTN